MGDSLSAGSGGSVSIYGNVFQGGNSNISVSGGASFNNKGAGAGGIVKIFYQ
jgi:hypothetical protein